ncbi:MAG: ABC transporter substrate-binding protein [Rhizobiales bacterium]|nr:ABC transporter substrate-binding protein [Hyphomicrobiales bacterium]
MKKRLLRGAGAAGLLALLTTAAVAADGQAGGDTSGKNIALATYSLTNSWHQQMLKTFEAASDQAIKDGLIAKVRAVDANNDVNTQASQISNLIVEGWDAIVLDAVSPTALNGVIKQACDAGIVVVVYDAIATEPCAYRLTFDFKQLGTIAAEHVAQQLGGKGNVLEIRGLAGTSVETDIHDAVVAAFAKYPDIKIVGSVYGSWNNTDAQREVAAILPTLPQIDAVVGQGGDGWGAYQAFKAAGRPIPLMTFGNRQDELKLWSELAAAGKYPTISLSSAPGIASVAFWVAQQILAGKEVPHDMVMPLLVINDAELPNWLSNTPDGGVATPVYSQKYAVDLIDATTAGKPVPPPVAPPIKP